MKNIINYQGRLIIAFALVCALLVLFLLPDSLEPYRSDVVNIPSSPVYFDAKGSLDELQKGDITLHWPGKEVMPVRQISIKNLDEPTLFVIMRSSIGGSKGYSDDSMNEKDNNIEIGFKRVVNFASTMNSYTGYGAILLSINTSQTSLRRGVAFDHYLWPVNQSLANYFHGALVDQPSVLNELGALVDMQDRMVGRNGYNPKNIALLAYYPEIKKFILIDDSQFLGALRQDFWYGGTRAYDPIKEDSMLFNGSIERAKFRSFPDSLVNQMSNEEILKRTGSYLKDRALPLTIETKKNITLDLLKHGFEIDDN